MCQYGTHQKNLLIDLSVELFLAFNIHQECTVRFIFKGSRKVIALNLKSNS